MAKGYDRTDHGDETDRYDTPVYLRDLNDEARASEEHKIRESGRRDLIAALDKSEDIIIGYYLRFKHYEAD